MSHHDLAKNEIQKLLRSSLGKNEYEECLTNHSLRGYLYPDSIDWKKQYFRNTVQLQMISTLADDILLQDKFIVLKGMSFGEYEIYQNWGERHTSDIDLLVEDIVFFSNRLRQLGFHLVENHKWKGNDFKGVFCKYEAGIEVIIELHSRLFFHTNGTALKFKKINSNFYVFEIEDLLLHLVGHLGFQHTFLKIHWLLDIFLLLEKYQSTINWERFFYLLDKFQLKRSWHYTVMFLDLVFKNNKPKGFYDRFLVDTKLLLFPEKQFLRYYLLKNSLKDSFYISLKYNLLWLWQRGWRK